MKSIKYISGLIVAMMMVSSCNNDDMPQVVGDNDVKVSATISGIQSRANTEGNGGKFTAGDKIVLTNTTNNTTATYVTADESGAFAPVGEEVVTWAPSVKNNFRAYGPESASYESFTIPSDQSTIEGIRSADWLKAEAKNVVRPDDATLALNFNHQLAKVTMTITEYTGSLAGANVANFTPSNVTLNSAAKIVGSGAAYGLHTITPYVIVDKSAGKHSFVALIAPQAYKSGDLFMSFTLNGRSYKVMANSDLCSSDFLKAGKNYCFNLRVDGTEEVGIGNVSVLDWEEGDVVNNLGGNLSSPYDKPTITVDPNNAAHAIIQANSEGQFNFNITVPAGITDITIKGADKAINELNGGVYNYITKYNVVLEDVVKIKLLTNNQFYTNLKILTLTHATHLLNLNGGDVTSEWDNTTQSRKYSYISGIRTIKALKPLEFASSTICDYKKYNDYNTQQGSTLQIPTDLYPNNSKSEMTLYLSANQKKMVLQDVRISSEYSYDNIHTYRPSDENFWASGEKEKSNVEFCGITFKKIIKIQ